MDSYPEMDWRRLVRFLTGECSPGQGETIQAWILEDEDRAKLMDELKRIWDASEAPIPPRDVDAAWEEVNVRLESDAPGGESEPNGKEPPSTGTTGSPPSDEAPSGTLFAPPSRWGSSLVARPVILGGMLLAVGIAVSYVFYEGTALFPDEPAPRTFSTEAGQRATVRLGDGSKVRLNVDSRLEVRSGFGRTNRSVHLDGEAYFEVTDDEAHSFVVRVDGARTEVLGTAFGVRAYPDAEAPKIAVAEGQVTVHSDRSTVPDTVRLGSNTLGMISGEHIKVVRQNAEIQKAIAWTDGRLVFDDTPFDQVVRRLQRWYDSPVKAQVDAEKVDRLNATFEEESFRQAIRAISVALDLQYRKDGRAVVFYRRGAPDGG